MKVYVIDEPGDAPGWKDRVIEAINAVPDHPRPPLDNVAQLAANLTGTALRRENAIERAQTGQVSLHLLNYLEIAQLGSCYARARGEN